MTASSPLHCSGGAGGGASRRLCAATQRKSKQSGAAWRSTHAVTRRHTPSRHYGPSAPEQATREASQPARATHSALVRALRGGGGVAKAGEFPPYTLSAPGVAQRAVE